MAIKSVFLSVVCVCIVAALGCSRSATPLMPRSDDKGHILVQASAADSHYILSFGYVSVNASDPGGISWEVVPVRDAAAHWNILTFLENAPCSDCFAVTGITPSGVGTLYVDV